MTFAALSVAAALLAGAAPDDRTEAVRLARAGAHEEALGRFREHARRDPADLEVRTWIAQLLAWTNRPAEAERAFRDVLAEAPRAVDAHLGLGLLLHRQGRHDEALARLTEAERLDPARADTLAALGRVHRQAGRTGLALACYRRAAGLAPADAEVRRGLELTRAQHDHRLETRFAYERLPSGTPSGGIGSIDLSLRARQGLRVALRQQVQRRFDLTESRTGAALEWQAAGATRLRAEAAAAPGAAVLPRTDAGFTIEHSLPHSEVAGALRYARFESAHVWMAAPAIVVPVGERLFVSGRYFLTVTSFDRLGTSVVHHSAGGAVRARVSERLWLGGGYARGHESFETLTAERLGRYRADTFAGTVRVDLPRSAVHAGVECERGAGRNLWRLTTGLTRRF